MAFGRLDRGSGPQPFSEINVTPLVDVMLVLVVILIITAPLLSSSIQLNLPKAAAAQPGTPPQSVTLVLDAQGQAYLNDRPLGDEALARELTQAATRRPDTEVQLRADTTVPYGRVVVIMGLAHQAGLTRIGFVASPVGTPATASSVR